MSRKEKLLTDPGVSTFFRKAFKESPAQLEELCNSIGVNRQRGRNWMKELANEGLLTVERKNGETTVKVEEENIQKLNSFASELQNNLTQDLEKWDKRLGQAANEMIRIKEAVDDDERVEELNEKLQALKQDSEEIDMNTIKSLSNVESYLGYGEIAREEMHAFHRKFKVLDKIKGL
ncbi:hypothetical protein [Candidatus Nanohalovita haloferacivicina]|uniref:hypothetical protein n=1 Tax=Candidatus Nanohalovita haloferacivicina TaxID=2978046 RepID=UPI00325FABA6|nr:hypothetical protein HBNXNv_0695 [Candidatus Nanohalobia archaeon BNXNv]